jgi:hypothetical protein
MSQQHPPPADTPPKVLRRFAEETQATEGEVQLLRQRVAAHRNSRKIPFRWPQLTIAGLATLGLLWLWLRPPTESPSQAPAGLANSERPSEPPSDTESLSAAELVAEIAESTEELLLQPTPGLTLRTRGRGQVSGTAAQPHLTWNAGDIHLDVDPAAKLDLKIETREAEISVIGTAFLVRRDAFGTLVRVDRGKVSVQCGKEPSSILESTQEILCLPVTASGHLARARALETHGATPAEVLAAVALGESSDDISPALQGELRVVAMEQHLREGDEPAALRAIEVYLQSGGPRGEELTLRGAQLAYRQGSCAAAAPWLERLPPEAREPDTLGKELTACLP